MTKAITLGTNAKGELVILQPPDVPIGDQHAHFDKINLGELPKGVARVELILFDDTQSRVTRGIKGAVQEREAQEARAKEKAAVEKARLEREATTVADKVELEKARIALEAKEKAKAAAAKAKEPATK